MNGAVTRIRNSPAGRRMARIFMGVYKRVYKRSPLWAINPLAIHCHPFYNLDMNQTFLFWRLQKIDTSLDQVQARLKEIEAQLHADQTVAASQAALEACEQGLQKARKLQK